MAVRPSVAVVDYHKGNLSSAARGLIRAGSDAFITDDPARIRAADGIVLPGVGSFYDAITFMRKTGQDEAVIEAVARAHGTPFLGICLGLQLLFERGDEGVPQDVTSLVASDARGGGLRSGDVFEADGRLWVRGLGVLGGSCSTLPSRRLKVPHVGWDQLHMTSVASDCPLLLGIDEGVNMYFTHSYALDEDIDASIVAAQTFYTRGFGAVVWRDNVFACQFHPEKSSTHGLEILRNFVRIVAAHRGGGGHV